jgi:hypothetical protein
MHAIADDVASVVSAFPGHLAGLAAAGVGIAFALAMAIRWVTRPLPKREMLRRLERLLRDPRFPRRKLATLNRKVISPSSAALRSAIESLGGVTEIHNGVEYVRLPDHVPTAFYRKVKSEVRRGPWKRRKLLTLIKRIPFAIADDIRAAAPFIDGAVEFDNGVEYIRLRDS